MSCLLVPAGLAGAAGLSFPAAGLAGLAVPAFAPVVAPEFLPLFLGLFSAVGLAGAVA